MKFEEFLLKDAVLKNQLDHVEHEYKTKRDKILSKMGQLIADSYHEGWT